MVKCKPEMASKLINTGGGGAGIRGWGLNNEISFPDGDSCATC